MKKKHLLILGAPILSCLVLSGCGDGSKDEKDPPVIEHTHQFATEWDSNETYHWHNATCEHTTLKDSEGAHQFIDDPNKTDIPSTEEEKGKDFIKCSVCGYETYNEIPLLSHTHTFADAWTSDETSHWHASTCGHADEKSGVANHEFGQTTYDWAEDGSTCTASKKCGICEKEITEDGVITSAVKTASSCIEKGTTTYTASFVKFEASTKDVQDIDKIAHTKSDVLDSDDYSHWYKCTTEGCNEHIDEASHNYVLDGDGKLVCSDCSHQTTELISKDADEGTSKYRLEAENANIVFDSTYTDWRTEFSDVNNLSIGFGLSNFICTRNVNYPGTSFTYNLTSDKTCIAKIDLRFSTHADKTYPYDMSKRVALFSEGKINGKTVTVKTDLSDFVVQSVDETETMVFGGNVDQQYFRFVTGHYTIPVFEGDTKIWFEYLGNSGVNVDYIELDTTATLSGFDPTHYTDTVSNWYISTDPTEDTTGIMTISREFNDGIHTYSYGIPALKTDGEVTPGYTVDSSSGHDVYKFTIKGKEFVVDPERNPIVSIKEGSKLQFSDGSTTKEIARGTTLTADLFKAVDGRVPQTVNIISNGATLNRVGLGSYNLTGSDITIEEDTYVREGFKLLQFGNEQSGSKPQVYEGMNRDNFSIVANNVTVIENEEDYPELGNIARYNGEVTTSQYFRFLTVVDSSAAVVKINKTHTFAYNFINLGETDIHLKLYAVNSGVNIESGDEGHAIDLAPGQKMTLVFDMKFALGSNNKNVMSLFKVTQNMPQGFKLGTSFSIKLAA